MLGQRAQTILEILVREYIRTAEPISSEKIAGRLKHVSPATVRNIFAELTEEGYIEQPHVSGGRVPRAQGYRFFVNKLLAGEARTLPLPNALEQIVAHFDGEFEYIHRIQEEIARHFKVLSRFGPFAPVGFEEVFRKPEFNEPALMQELGKFLDEFEKCRDDYERELREEDFKVYIGEENTVQLVRHISIVVARGRDELFFLAGPTRMPYDRIITFMKIWHKNPMTM